MGKVVVTTETTAEQAYVLALNQELRPRDRAAVFAVIAKYEELRTAQMQLTAKSLGEMEDHILRELVNDLRDLAVQYHDHQSLRERLRKRVMQAVAAGKNIIDKFP